MDEADVLVHYPFKGEFLKMKERKIFISGKVPDSLENILSDLGRVVKLPAFNKLPEPVSSHGDMLIFKDSTGKIFVPKEYYDLNKELFQDMDLECVCEEFSDKYPEDVYLDALLLGDHLICKERYTAKKIKAGKKIKDVKQGYARCSVCLLGRRAAITADGGIAKRLEELGSKTLIISAGDICLE